MQLFEHIRYDQLQIGMAFQKQIIIYSKLNFFF
jgi:hypothetical protein